DFFRKPSAIAKTGRGGGGAGIPRASVRGVRRPRLLTRGPASAGRAAPRGTDRHGSHERGRPRAARACRTVDRGAPRGSEPTGRRLTSDFDAVNVRRVPSYGIERRVSSHSHSV